MKTLNTALKFAAIVAATATLVACGGGGGSSAGGGTSVTGTANDPDLVRVTSAGVANPFAGTIERDYLGTGAGIATVSTNADTAKYVNFVAPGAAAYAAAPAAAGHVSETLGAIRADFGKHSIAFNPSSFSLATTQAQADRISAAPANAPLSVNGVIVLSGRTTGTVNGVASGVSGSYVMGGAIPAVIPGVAGLPKYITSVASNNVTDTNQREAYLIGSAALIMGKFGVNGERAASAINIAATQITPNSNVNGYNFQVNNVLAPNKALR